MSDSAVEIADLLKYKSAGTVEFIVVRRPVSFIRWYNLTLY